MRVLLETGVTQAFAFDLAPGHESAFFEPFLTGSLQKARMTSSRVLIVLAATFIAGAAVAADAVFPPGSRIGLVPPPDMKPSRGVSGFRDPRTGAAIVAIEMPAEAYPSLAAGFSDEALKAQGFKLETRETPRIGIGGAILVSGEQTEGAAAVPKTVLLASDPSMTALVIAQAPRGAPASVQAEIMAALRTVALRAPLALDEQIDALPFRIGDMAGFRPVRVAAGNSVFLTEGASDTVRGAEQPILIVAQSFAPAPPLDQHANFARSALVANNFVKDAVIERAQSFRQGGVQWNEIVAKAKDVQSDQSVIVMQTIRFDQDSYTRMVGVVRADQRDAVMPRFRRVVDSLAVK